MSVNENTEKAVTEKLAAADEHLKRLMKEHTKLHQKLERFEKRPFLTVLEEMERKKLKMKKLHGKEKIMQIMAQKGVTSFELSA